MKRVNVLFLLPYPLHQAPSQRFRIEAFFPHLKDAGIHYDTQVFLSDKGWKHLYKKGSYLQKAGAVLSGYLRRIGMALFTAWKYDYIVVHREAAPLGPPVFEWWLANVLRKKLIFDFDDAIWIPAITEGNSLASFAKCFWKTKWICKWSYKVSAGNHYLAEYASAYSKRVAVIPTCVDVENRYNVQVQQQVQKVTIGWTGSHSTLKYLDTIYPVLRQLEQRYDFEFLVICNKQPAFTLRSLRYKEWKEASEIADLATIHIGIMPLVHDAWSEGKCGFKIIQYLALGIPAVASPVGVNQKIVEEGVNGFLCQNEAQWMAALEKLLLDHSLREKMGKAGREKIVQQFSVQAHGATFLRLFT